MRPCAERGQAPERSQGGRSEDAEPGLPTRAGAAAGDEAGPGGEAFVVLGSDDESEPAVTGFEEFDGDVG